jgi:hypothetical protein
MIKLNLESIRWKLADCLSLLATTKAKAQWIAVKSYWEAYGRRHGEWPRARAVRAERYDNSHLRLEKRQQAWSEDYVRGW